MSNESDQIIFTPMSFNNIESAIKYIESQGYLFKMSEKPLYRGFTEHTFLCFSDDKTTDNIPFVILGNGYKVKYYPQFIENNKHITKRIIFAIPNYIMISQDFFIGKDKIDINELEVA